MYVFYPFNKTYINYDYEKSRKCQYNVILQYREDRDYDYNSYSKRLSDNKLYNKNKEKDCIEYCFEYHPEHRFKYCSKNREYKP